MQITIELDEKTIAQIDSVANDFKKGRLQYINESVQKNLQKDLRKRKYSEGEISRMYKDACEKFPVQPDEFEIEDEQMEEFWNQI